MIFRGRPGDVARGRPRDVLGTNTCRLGSTSLNNMKPNIRNKTGTTLRRRTKKHIPDKELFIIKNKTKN